MIGEHLRPNIRLTPGDWRVNVGPMRAQQVSINLMISPRDAMLQRGRLMIDTSNVE